MTEQAAKDPATRLLPSMDVLISNFVTAATLVPLGLFVFSLLGRYFYFAELVCNFRCQIMLMLIPFAIFALGARRWLIGGMILVALGWSMIGIVWVYLPGYQPPAGPQVLKVMSYNVWATNTNYAEIANQIREIDPDFVSILEYASNWHEALNCLNDRYPYQARIPRWHGFGIAMFSKYPLSDTKVMQLTELNTDNPFIMTNVTFGNQTIRMAAIHAVSPTTRYRLELRNQQFNEAATVLAGKDVPTVIMGDFNCAPWSPFLIDFVKVTGYRDSRRGFGYHSTWPSDKWMMRIPIDHAFVSDDVRVHNRVVGKRSDSDHLPIILEVSTASHFDRPSISESSNTKLLFVQ